MTIRTFVVLALVLVGAFALVIVLSSKSDPGDGDSEALPGPAERPDEPEISMPPLPVAPDSGDAATISGRVLGPDGGPVAGAEVALLFTRKPVETSVRERELSIRMGSGGMSAAFGSTNVPVEETLAVVTSGADGTFRVSTTAAGPFDLTARRPGFAAARVGKVKRGDRDVVLHLAAAGRLRGLVTDEGGAPVPAAIVRSGDATELADDEGRFELADVSAGEGVEVFAAAEGYGEAKATVRVTEGAVTDVGPLVLAATPGISGRVFDQLGEPLEGVTVSCMSGTFDSKSGSSDRGGRYHIAVVDDGTVDLAFAHPEYLPGKLEGLEYAKGRSLFAPDLRLLPGGEIVGRITDDEGNPVAGAKVAAVATATEMDFQVLMMMAMGGRETLATDAEGKYRIAGLEAGAYTLNVNADGFRPSLLRDIEVRVPEKTPVDVRLDPGFRLAGIVVDADGAPVAGAKVSATAEGTPGNIQEAILLSGSEANAVSGEDGRFVLKGLSENPLTVTTTADGFAANTSGGVDPAAEELRVELKRTGSISGLVLDAETAEPIADASVSVGDITSRGAETGEDGTFTVSGVSPGSHEITVNAAGYAPGVVQEIGVSEAAETKGVEIRLSRGLTAVGFVVRNADGTPIAEARVSFSGPVDQDARTDETGRFEIVGLVPGRYDVRAVATGFAERVLKGTEIPCDLEIRIGLGLGGTVRGIVRDEDGEPNAGKMVMLGSGMSFGENVSLTGSDGSFTFEHVRPGKYTVLMLDMKAGGGGFGFGGSNTRQVTVREGEETFVEIGGKAAPKTVRLSGRLLDRGKPVANKSFVLFPADVGEDGSGVMGLMTKLKMIQTDSEGRFDVSEISPGKYRVFHGALGSEMGAGGELVVDGDGEIEKDIEMPAGSLRGTTASAVDGSPVSGAEVMVLDGDLAAGPVASFGAVLAMVKAQGVSDAEGNYEIPNVEPGRFLIEVRADGFAPRVVPGVVIREQGGAPLALRLSPGHRLTVKVIGAKETPVAGANVALLDAAGHWVLVGDDMGVTTGADGSATLRVEAGTWRIGVQAAGHAPTEQEVRVTREGELVVVLPAGGAVAVTATAGGGPLAGAKVRVIGDDGREIVPRLTEQAMLTGAGARVTGADGTLLIPDLPPGTVRVLVTSPDGGTSETTVRITAGEVASAAVNLK